MNGYENYGWKILAEIAAKDGDPDRRLGGMVFVEAGGLAFVSVR